MSFVCSPTRSFIAGLLLCVPVHLSPALLHSPYGISGVVHRFFTRDRTWSTEASTVGLVVGGALFGWILLAMSPAEAASVTQDESAIRSATQWAKWVVSGAAVGAGSKLANGCTSGHMLSGLTRRSPRSMVATTLFFAFGSLAVSLLPKQSSSATPVPLLWDWSVGLRGGILATSALVAAAVATNPITANKALAQADNHDENGPAPQPSPSCAAITSFLLSLSFALSLALSGMLVPSTILAFLAPFSRDTTWNPSLLFLAAAIPLSIAIYRGPWPERDQQWKDRKLWVGAALFGLGWGASGVCPGPAVVNLGRATVLDLRGVGFWAAWVGACVLGGKVAQSVWV